LAFSTAQGCTASCPDKKEVSEALSPFLCPWTRLCWKPVHNRQQVQHKSQSPPEGAGRLRRISGLLSAAAGTDGLQDLFKGGDPQVLRANPCKSTLLIAK